MEQKKCDFCGKIIEGYCKNINHLMKQHMMVHDKEKPKEEDIQTCQE